MSSPLRGNDSKDDKPGASPAAGALPSGMYFRAGLLLVLAFAAVLLFCHLGMTSLWGSEGRWAVIARHMLQTGELFNPMLGTAPYWDKPLVSYWQILPAAYLLGGVSEYTSRLPSALWAIVLLLLTCDLARRWVGWRSALMSAAVLGSTYGFMFWGRNAQVEMTNAAIITLVLWCYFTRGEGRKAGWVYVLAVLMGVGANMKGLTAVAVPVFCILVHSLVKQGFRLPVKPVHLVLAGLLFTAAFFLIPLASCLYSSSWTPLFMVWKENVIRFFEPFDHKGPIYIYFLRIFDLAAPWSLMLPPALVLYLKGGRHREEGITDALLMFGAIFLFFTLSGSRRPYYLLPILPFASILSGHLLAGFFGRTLPRGVDRAVLAMGLLISTCFLVPLIAVLIKPSPFVFPIDSLFPWTVPIVAGGAIAAAGFIRRKPAAVAAPVAMVWLMWVLAFIPWQVGHHNDDRSDAVRVAAMNRPVGFLGVDDAKVIFYLDKPYTVLADIYQARAWAMKTGGVVIMGWNVNDPAWKRIVNRKDWKAFVFQGT